VCKTKHKALLQATEVGDVWGVVPKIGAQLRAQGINTALDLQRMSPAAAKAGWLVVLGKTVRELNGTRSFGHPRTELIERQEAIVSPTTWSSPFDPHQNLSSQGGKFLFCRL
jgi:nucleotidyltransferase/DNA polymerase involved in DNA repair